MVYRADGKLLSFLSGNQGLLQTMPGPLLSNPTDTCAVETSDQVAEEWASC